mmetsp:Transcript_106062/g.300045  ORF Transcript_106062/g.300045 Transcript_106062/m.300045 type:complete len:218 (-) Transcript_106062:70-723(-)
MHQAVPVPREVDVARGEGEREGDEAQDRSEEIQPLALPRQRRQVHPHGDHHPHEAQVARLRVPPVPQFRDNVHIEGQHDGRDVRGAACGCPGDGDAVYVDEGLVEASPRDHVHVMAPVLHPAHDVVGDREGQVYQKARHQHIPARDARTRAVGGLDQHVAGDVGDDHRDGVENLRRHRLGQRLARHMIVRHRRGRALLIVVEGLQNLLCFGLQLNVP